MNKILEKRMNDDNINQLTADFEKILYIKYDEYTVLLSAEYETQRETLIRYKRYLLGVDNWKELYHVYLNILKYIQNPNILLKQNIDTLLILFIESL